MLCLLCHLTNVGKQQVLCFCCKVIVATFAVNYATCHFILHLYGEREWEKKFASKLESRVMSRPSGTRIVPAAAFRKKIETARGTFRSLYLEAVSRFVQGTVTFVGIAVVMRGKGR